MKRRQFTIASIALIGLAFLLWKNNPKETYIYNEGYIFGTSYHLIYASANGTDYGQEVHQHLINVVDQSLSTFNKSSVISKVNNNQEHLTDSAFELVFNKAQEISQLTDGAFDITVAPLVNTWGFGYTTKDEIIPSEDEIATLLEIVGYQSVELKALQVVKEHPETKLDCSAIAKGFSVDVAAEFLKDKGIQNFMVEIGGEIRVGGMNKQGEKWRLGIDKPIEDITASQRVLDTILYVTDKAIATSGNYRQFYYKDGQRYSHTINPITGYPVNHTLLSATVLAADCMTADALATACMVMGAEKSLALAKRMENIDLLLIVDDHGKTKELFTEGLEKYLHP